MDTNIHTHSGVPAVIRPMGKTWDAPGHPLNGKEMCECLQCGTSVSHTIAPFVFPQLRQPR